jgi:hypothetical protein
MLVLGGRTHRDELFAEWPDRVRALESHAYTFESPAAAVLLQADTSD